MRTGTEAEQYSDGRLWLGLGSLEVDRVIALPRLLGPRLRGVPCDPLGFVPVDEFTRVLGREGVHAVGDIAAHAVKQGGLAAQQADVAAAVIAAEAGADVRPRPYRPVLRGLLLTGGEARHLRHDPRARPTRLDELLWWPPARSRAATSRPTWPGTSTSPRPPRSGAGIALRVVEPPDAR